MSPARKLGLVTVLAIAPLPACGAQRGHRALKEGRYRAAVRAYDDVLRRQPKRDAVRAKREQARAALVARGLAKVATMRGQGRDADATAVVELLARWAASWTIAPADLALVHAEIERSAVFDHRDAAVRLTEDGPLAARAALPPVSALLGYPAYGTVRNETRAAIDATGAQRCAGLVTAAAGRPYVALLAQYYCASFEATPPPLQPRPDACATPRFRGHVVGATAVESEAMVAALTAAFEASGWHDPTAPCEHAIVLTGRRDDQYTTTPVRLTARWDERQAYQATESYQQAYTVSEPYQAQESYTTYRSESYSCGYNPPRTCTRSVPQTQSRSVTRYRSATKYRTQTRTVTRYRVIPRQLQYAAVNHEYRYVAEGQVTLPLAAASAQWSRAQLHEGIEHAVTHVAAGLTPVQATLPTRPQELALEAAVARQHFATALRSAFAEASCPAVAEYDADMAAACVLARPETLPAPAAAALRESFGDAPEAIAALVSEDPWPWANTAAVE